MGRRKQEEPVIEPQDERIILVYSYDMADKVGYYVSRVNCEDGKQRRAHYTAIVPEGEFDKVPEKDKMLVWTGPKSDWTQVSVNPRKTFFMPTVLPRLHSWLMNR